MHANFQQRDQHTNVLLLNTSHPIPIGFQLQLWNPIMLAHPEHLFCMFRPLTPLPGPSQHTHLVISGVTENIKSYIFYETGVWFDICIVENQKLPITRNYATKNPQKSFQFREIFFLNYQDQSLLIRIMMICILIGEKIISVTFITFR